MLLSLLLTGLLTAQAGPAAPASQASHEAAVELAQNGEYEQALEAFRRIASQNPRDHASRLWIARLHVWMGNDDLAEPVFRSVMLEDPSNVEARVGLGRTLVALRRGDEAVMVLEQAEQNAPDNPDVLVALGRARRYTGDTTLSLGYLQRAVAIAPTSMNRAALERTRVVHDHRVETTGFVESFNIPVADTRNGDIAANIRITDRFRVIGRGQYQRKFGISEQRGGIGLEWRGVPQTTLHAHALIGPGNDVLPRTDGNLELVHVRGAMDWVAGLRYIDFSAADVTVFSPGVTWWASDRLSLGLRYAAAFTNVDTSSSGETGHTAQLRGSYLVYPRVWANLGYTRGVDNFDTLSPDRLGDFRANTASGGLRVELPSLTSLIGQYEHQRRPNDTEMNRVTISIVQRF